MKSTDIKKVAIVTGGASGIRLAIAEKFVAESIHTIVIGRDKAKLQNVKKKLGNLCYTFSFDLNNISAIPSLVKDIIKQFDHIDILVNNAGINMKKDFTEVTDEEFQQ